MIERCYSLRAAAKVLGIDRKTLKAWLVSELALRMPEVRRGSKAVIRHSDLERLLEKRGPRVDWTILRMDRKAQIHRAVEQRRTA